jgi:hypothetical protein
LSNADSGRVSAEAPLRCLKKFVSSLASERLVF